MKDEERLICNRLLDMANSCYHRNIPVTTDFLDLNSQSLFWGILNELPPVRWVFIGGYPLAERKMLIFYPDYMDEADVKLSTSEWFSVIRIKPANKKFAEDLNHRDFLGSIMGLGINRSKIGDIIIQDSSAYFFCCTSIAKYITDNLCQIKHTTVTCEIVENMSFDYEPRYEEITGSISSLRLDSVISLGFNSSRSHIIKYIEEGKTFVNGRIITSNGHHIKPDDLISIRGLGKIKFIREITTTKKGRLMIIIHKYI